MPHTPRPSPARTAAPSPLSRRSLLTASGSAAAATLGSLGWSTQAVAAPAVARCTFDGLQPVVLTVSGPGIEPNRGALNPSRDILLARHGLQFDAAWACGRDAINSLEQATLHTHIEYDEQPHSLRGPLLETVLQAAGLDLADALRRDSWVHLQALDGYRVQMPLRQALRWRYLLATHMDGQALAMGGLGPLWAMYDPTPLAQENPPVAQPLSQAVLGLYYIAVSPQKPQA